MIVLAHGIGGRADLPVPLTLALYGAGLTVVVSFLALVLLWRRPRLRGAVAGRPLPAVIERVVDGRNLPGVSERLTPFPIEWEQQRPLLLCAHAS